MRKAISPRLAISTVSNMVVILPIRNSGWPASTSLARTSRESPSTVPLELGPISLNTFIASIMQSTCPASIAVAGLHEWRFAGRRLQMHHAEQGARECSSCAACGSRGVAALARVDGLAAAALAPARGRCRGRLPRRAHGPRAAGVSPAAACSRSRPLTSSSDSGEPPTLDERLDLFLRSMH